MLIIGGRPGCGRTIALQAYSSHLNDDLSRVPPRRAFRLQRVQNPGELQSPVVIPGRW